MQEPEVIKVSHHADMEDLIRFLRIFNLVSALLADVLDTGKKMKN
jgi:hypothetical protein